jgi:hypothetical protein
VWQRFIHHREADRGDWLTVAITWNNFCLISGRTPSPLDDPRCEAVVIEFARNYMPDPDRWIERLLATGICVVTEAKVDAKRESDHPFSEAEALSMMALEDVLEASLSGLLQDDLEERLVARGFAPAIAARLKYLGKWLLPQTSQWPNGMDNYQAQRILAQYPRRG